MTYEEEAELLEETIAWLAEMVENSCVDHALYYRVISEAALFLMTQAVHYSNLEEGN